MVQAQSNRLSMRCVLHFALADTGITCVVCASRNSPPRSPLDENAARHQELSDSTIDKETLHLEGSSQNHLGQRRDGHPDVQAERPSPAATTAAPLATPPWLRLSATSSTSKTLLSHAVDCGQQSQQLLLVQSRAS
eukprot:scpid22626/ scgid23332/ 